MKMPIDKELRAIFRKIFDEGLPEEGWAALESDDMFQSTRYDGGFDATENAFCFSMYSGDQEFWFQVTLGEIEAALRGEINSIEVRSAEI